MSIHSILLQKLTKEVQTTLAEANKVAEESISSMRTVRSFANECGEADSYYAKLLLMFQLNKKQALAYACYMWSSSVSLCSCVVKANFISYLLIKAAESVCVFRSHSSEWRLLSSTTAVTL